MTRFLVVPQWQGSSSARAMQLIDGAAAIAGDLPKSATVTVDVPLEAGEDLDSGVRRLSALQQTAHAQREALEALNGSGQLALTIGGDAGVAVTAALAAVTDAEGMLDPDAAVLWFSAHADLHDAQSSPTGAFDTMSVRALLDESIPRPAGHTIAAGRLILAGVRAVEPAEAAVIDRLGVVVVPADALSPERIVESLVTAGVSSVFIHVDLDVLDPAALTGLATPEPFGPGVATLTACIAAVREALPLRAAAITEFAPASPADAVGDLGAILRLVGALA